MKVLVVDDNIAIQEILKDILIEEGHVVRIAGSISEAVDQILEFEPNAILLDSIVNDEDGLQILSHAHEKNPELSLDTVLIKSLNEEAPQDSTFIKAVVNKPFKSTDIAAALNVLVSKKEEEKAQEARNKRKKSNNFLNRIKRNGPVKKEPKIEVDESAVVAEYIAAEGPLYGRSYVFFEKEPVNIVGFVNIFSPKDYSTLVISSDNAKAVMQNYDHEDIDVVTLSSVARGKTMDISALGTLTVFIKKFIEEHEKPIIMIEDFTEIIDSNGLNHSLVFLHQLIKERPGKPATFVISVDPTILTTKDRNILLGDMSEYSN